MTLTSLAFWQTLLPLLLLYWLLPKGELQNILLLAASILFYNWVDPGFTLLLTLSILLDHALLHAFYKIPPTQKTVADPQPTLQFRGPGLFQVFQFFC